MSLRLRLSGVLLLAVGVALLGATLAHLLEVSSRLEEQLDRQVDRVVASVTTEMLQTGEVLDEEVAIALSPNGPLARKVASPRAPQRFLSAKARLQKGRVEILKVLTPTGQIITSGHWPASYGALDSNIELYKSSPGKSAIIVDEATPNGSRSSLQRWSVGQWGRQPVIVVVGRFLDRTALARMRERSGADLLAFCRAPPRVQCVTVKNEEVISKAPFSPDASWLDSIEMARVSLGNVSNGPTLFIGLDRSQIDDVGSGLIRRAVIVGLMCALFALILGVLVSSRVVRPIEALADAADQLAEGKLSTRVSASRSSGPEVEGLVNAFNSMAQDIERSQQKLKQAERVAAWREIARGLAHELKNPLTPIMGAMDVIRKAHKLKRNDFDDILEEQASSVVEEVLRLKELADAFARFARLPEPKIEDIDVKGLLEHTLGLYASGDVEVKRSYDVQSESELHIEADRTQLNSVVSNLIKNAVEAMEGHGILHIGIREGQTHEGRKALVIDIGDSGPGIAEEIKERLFTPYVTTKGSRGTGLGLALVHRIVAEHGGEIEVLESPSKGAQFSITLPKKQLAQNAADAIVAS